MLAIGPCQKADSDPGAQPSMVSWGSKRYAFGISLARRSKFEAFDC